MNLSPGLTGVFKEDIRFIGNYRRQWHSVPVSYLTFSGAVDMKFFHRKLRSGFLAGGILFNRDQAGDSEYSLTQLALSGSYTHQVGENNLLTLGVQLGGGQRSIQPGGLTFGNQFNGDIFVATLDTRENFTSENTSFSDISTGLNWHLQQEDQLFWLDLGFGLFHLTEPQVSFYNEPDSKLARRMSFYGMGGVKLNAKMDLVGHIIYQKQGPRSEGIGGTAIRYRFIEQRGKEMAVQFGTSYRFLGVNDAFIPAVEIHFASWRCGFSYDVNLSDFNLATNKNGGPELALIYTITKVKPVGTFKACPIF